MSEEKQVIYCPDCGKENAPEATLCRDCGEAINQEEHLFRDYLKSYIKDELKGKVTGTLYSVVKNWLLSHLYASVITVTLIAAVTTGAVGAAHVRSTHVAERPAPIAELDILSSAERALFEANSNHEIFGPEDYEEVWRPAALAHTIRAEEGSCYGWVVVRDMTVNAEGLFDGCSEIYIAPGVTLTVNGKLTAGKGFNDFYVAQGAVLIINGDIKGGANICNDGTTVVNGDFDGGSAQLCCNRGDFTVSGAFTGALDFYSFRGASVSGTDRTDSGLHYYDIDASDLYQGVTGISGMFIAVGGLE